MNYFLLGQLVGLLYSLYSLTFRYKVHYTSDSFGPNEMMKLLAPIQSPESCAIFAVWHQDEMSIIPYFKNSQVSIMVSTSKDGDLLAGALNSLGLSTVRGSSNKNPIAAFLSALKSIQRGRSMAFAVDGPRGPIYEVKEGVIRLAEKTSKPIIPMRALPEKSITFKNSWSKSKLPLPFTKIHLTIGKPNFYNATTLASAINSLDYSL